MPESNFVKICQMALPNFKVDNNTVYPSPPDEQYKDIHCITILLDTSDRPVTSRHISSKVFDPFHSAYIIPVMKEHGVVVVPVKPWILDISGWNLSRATGYPTWPFVCFFSLSGRILR